MFIEAPKEVSTCRSKGPKGELVERAYDYVIPSQNLKGKITKMEVVEDFEFRPHKAVSFVIERDKEVGYLLPCTLGEERVLQTPETRPISES